MGVLDLTDGKSTFSTLAFKHPEGYYPVGEVGSHASDEGGYLSQMVYSTLLQCEAACDANPACKHFTACPGDGNKCYFHRGTNQVADSTGVGRQCQMYFPARVVPYTPVGAIGTHASDEGAHLLTMTYTSLADCEAACSSNPSCKHFTACPDDGNKCYLKDGTLQTSTHVAGRKCRMYFPSADVFYLSLIHI